MAAQQPIPIRRKALEENLAMTDLCMVFDFIDAVGQALGCRTVFITPSGDAKRSYFWDTDKARRLKVIIPNPRLDALIRPLLTEYEWWLLVKMLSNPRRHEMVAVFRTAVANPAESRVNITQILLRVMRVPMDQAPAEMITPFTEARLRGFFTLFLGQVSCGKIRLSDLRLP